YVAEPAAVLLPALLEPDRRRQPFLDRGERFHVALDLEMLDREAGLLEEPANAGLAVREARGAARLLPLVVVKRDEREHLARPERPARPLGDGVKHAEVGDDEVGLERRVLLDLDVAHDKTNVGKLGGGGAAASLVDCLRVSIDADDSAAERRQREGDPAGAGARVQHRQVRERLALEPLEKYRAQLVGRLGGAALSR